MRQPGLSLRRRAHEHARIASRRAELLRTEDMIVLPDLHLSGLDAALRECAPSVPCAIETRSALGVDLLIGLTIWGTAADPSTAESVHASVIDTTGTRYVGSATVRQGVPTAVRDALREVLRRQLRGPGPHLDIAGTETAVCELKPGSETCTRGGIRDQSQASGNRTSGIRNQTAVLRPEPGPIDHRGTLARRTRNGRTDRGY